MGFKRHDWKDFQFDRSAISGEVIIKENGRKIDNLIFNNNEGYKKVLIILKKYGFGNDLFFPLKENVN